MSKENQQPVELTELIKQAVEEGNAEYWRPSNEHDAALREWKLGGFKGERPSMQQSGRGSIVDCISVSVNQKLLPYLSATKREINGEFLPVANAIKAAAAKLETTITDIEISEYAEAAIKAMNHA